MSAPETYADAIGIGSRRLRDSDIATPGTDARWLLADAAGVNRDRLIALSRDPLPPGVWPRFERALKRRIAREPVSMITGRKDFYGRSFAVDRAVLSPRPETETLVALALSEPFGRVLDLGLGSGCILLTLLAENPDAVHGYGTEISPQALRIAGQNRDALGLSDRAVLCLGDWYEGLPAGVASFDLIVSNPPYVSDAEYATLSPEALHEPRTALTPGGDGLDAYRAIAAGLRARLAPGGRCLVEIGPAQGAAVAGLMGDAGLEDVNVHPDMDGRDRVVSGRCP